MTRLPDPDLAAWMAAVRSGSNTRRVTTEGQAIAVIESLLSRLPAAELRTDEEHTLVKQATLAIARLTLLQADRDRVGGWADLNHG